MCAYYDNYCRSARALMQKNNNLLIYIRMFFYCTLFLIKSKSYLISQKNSCNTTIIVVIYTHRSKQRSDSARAD